MAILTPPPAAPQRGDRTTFANRVDAFITWLINFVGELVALVANLNSIAAGGAYAIPYLQASSSAEIGGAAGGKLSFDVTGTTLYLDTKSAGGSNVSALINSFNTSASTKKGTIRIVAQNDPSKWLVYNTGTCYIDAGGAYAGIQIAGFVAGSAGNTYPFVFGDALLVYFQATGDKGDRGDKGDSATTAIIRVRDDRPAGTGGDAAVATTWATRTLNSTIWNNIAGASLSGNQITLPAGTYDYVGSAPAFQTNAHQMRLYNVTAGGAIDYGTNEFASSSTNVVTRSIVRGRMTLAATTVIAMQHWASSAGSFGVAALTGTIQSYAELTIEKVA